MSHPVLSASGVTKSFGDLDVLVDVSLTVAPGDRIGVVGPNGIGKSTLLRLLAGLEPPDRGRVTRTPTTLTVGWLPQETEARSGETVGAYLARRTGVLAAEAELRRAAELLSSRSGDPAVADRYDTALSQYLALGGGDLEVRAVQVAADVGLGADRLGQEVSRLSGGQAARAALAAVLLSRFDVLLLDEPTNDLDFAGLEQLEQFVGSTPAGVVVVSHDRAFLERVVDEVVELEDGTRRSRHYAGGWSSFVEAREKVRRHAYEAYDAYVEEKQRLVERARTQRRWSERGVKRAAKGDGATDKYIRFARRAGAENLASQAKMTERAIERLDPVDKPWEGWQLQLEFAPRARSGDVVVRLEGALVERGSFRLGPMDLEVGWGERVAIVGPNGSGKTTLLQAILGRLGLFEGRRWIGPGVVVGEMDQRRGSYSGDEALLDTFVGETGLLPGPARSALAKLGLGAADVLRPGRTLSPGERSRAVLGALMVRGVNCLVLDEPTNHLDLPAIEQLEAALDGYEGTLLLVTHDRLLLEAVRISRTVELGKT